jgi:hypothetical protein
MTIEPIYSPTDETAVATLETAIGTDLPSGYRRFLLTYNGGKPKPNIFFISAEEGTDILRAFLGLSDSGYYQLVEHYEDYLGRIPKNFLPIGVDTMVNLVCLSVAGDDYGKVYFWDHDREVTEGEPDYRNVYLLAESFDEFLSKLRDQ